jgi:NADH-quinone oxidoreductase subunit M
VAALFFVVGLLAKRAGGSEDLAQMGGLAFRAPVLASLFLIVTLATLAMPGSSNFVGEFLILLGVFKAKLAVAVIAFTGVVLASVYALRLFIRAMHNRLARTERSRELNLREATVLVPLVGVILFMALYPQLALHRSEGSAKLAVGAAAPGAHAALAPGAHAALAPGTHAALAPARARPGHREGALLARACRAGAAHPDCPPHPSSGSRG